MQIKGITILSVALALAACGSNTQSEQSNDTLITDKLSTDTLAKDTSTMKPGGSGDTTQTPYPSSRKSNTQ